MLHLSLLHLPRNLPRWHHLTPYDAHQIVWKAFTDLPEGKRPFLFSLDERGPHQCLLVQSTRSPDWHFLNGEVEVRTKTFDPTRIPTGTRLRFFLRANPTVDRKGFRDGKTRRVAVGINPELAFRQMGRPNDAPESLVERAAWRTEQLQEWLRCRGERGGFQIEKSEPGPIVARRLIRTENDRPRGRPMTFHEVEFTGALRSTNRESFARTCTKGLGRGKAFGYGLLMVRPA